MAFTGNFMCNTFKKELLFGVHDFANGADVFKLALYTNSASFTAATTAYTATNEVSHANYTAGGVALTNVDPVNDGSTPTTAYADFSPDAVFSNVSITARGALLYNSTPNTASLSVTNPTVLVLDFGEDKIATDGDFTVVFPAANASTAIIRIA